MNTERLLILADFLENVVHATMPTRFCYATWLGREWAGEQDLSCGTTACAMGWAPQVPQFKELGLYYQRRDGGGAEICSTGLKVGEVTEDTQDTGTALFDLEDDDEYGHIFWYLFYPQESPMEDLVPHVRGKDYDPERSYSGADWEKTGFSPPPTASAHDVAKHIRRFVKAWMAVHG